MILSCVGTQEPDVQTRHTNIFVKDPPLSYSVQNVNMATEKQSNKITTQMTTRMIEVEKQQQQQGQPVQLLW